MRNSTALKVNECDFAPCAVCNISMCVVNPCEKHQEGALLLSGQWVCSGECLEQAVLWYNEEV